MMTFENLYSYLIDIDKFSPVLKSGKKVVRTLKAYKFKYMISSEYLSDIKYNIDKITDNDIVNDYVCGIIKKVVMYEALEMYYQMKKIPYDDWLLKNDIFDYLDTHKNNMYKEDLFL